MSGLRLFIGVRVATRSLRALAACAETLSADSQVRLRWLQPAAYHVTLKFLGWSEPEIVQAVRDRGRQALAKERPFDVAVAGLGAFPSPERARVLWAGVDDAKNRLAEVAAVVDELTAALGFEPEKRAFHPHVTLARSRQAQNLSALIERAGDPDFGHTRVDRVVLFESTLRPEGAEYRELEAWELR